MQQFSSSPKILLILLTYTVIVGLYVMQKNDVDYSSLFDPEKSNISSFSQPNLKASVQSTTTQAIEKITNETTISDKSESTNRTSAFFKQNKSIATKSLNAPAIGTNGSSANRPCNKETEGWPPDKIGSGLRPYLSPSDNTTQLMPLLDSASMFNDDMDVPRPKTHIVVVCTSSSDAFGRRDTVRKTWGALAQDLPVTVIFLVGNVKGRLYFCATFACFS